MGKYRRRLSLQQSAPEASSSRVGWAGWVGSSGTITLGRNFTCGEAVSMAGNVLRAPGMLFYCKVGRELKKSSASSSSSSSFSFSFLHFPLLPLPSPPCTAYPFNTSHYGTALTGSPLNFMSSRATLDGNNIPRALSTFFAS